MAIIKHRSSKNAKYQDVFTYYTYRHRENERTGHYEPILDAYGLLQERDDYALLSLDAYGKSRNPLAWAGACMQTNLAFGKNISYQERKIHEYIISHPQEDRGRQTMEELLEEGRQFAHRYLQGHEVLLAVHRDTDNDHIHISFNSVRTLQRPEEPWMMRNETGEVLPCEVMAGGKHQDSPELRQDYQNWQLKYCCSHGLKAEDNLAVAARRKEARYGQYHEELRKIISQAAARTLNVEELTEYLQEEHGIQLIRRGNTISILPPDRQKPIRLKTLGMELEDLYRLFHYAETLQMVEHPSMEEERRRAAEKKYMHWIRERRVKNAQKAEQTIEKCESLLAKRLREQGESYDKRDFQGLHYLIQKTVYARRDLQTELDKIEAVQNQWTQYCSEEIPRKEREKHGNYLRWCGWDPQAHSQREELNQQCEQVRLELSELQAMCEGLTQTAEQWRKHNELAWLEKDLQWTIQREKQLKEIHSALQQNCKTLSQIAFHCKQAAKRHRSSEARDKADYYQGQWYQKSLKKIQIQKALKETKQKKKAAKKKLKAAKRVK